MPWLCFFGCLWDEPLDQHIQMFLTKTTSHQQLQYSSYDTVQYCRPLDRRCYRCSPICPLFVPPNSYEEYSPLFSIIRIPAYTRTGTVDTCYQQDYISTGIGQYRTIVTTMVCIFLLFNIHNSVGCFHWVHMTVRRSPNIGFDISVVGV
jgi:hypothetical protein